MLNKFSKTCERLGRANSAGRAEMLGDARRSPLRSRADQMNRRGAPTDTHAHTLTTRPASLMTRRSILINPNSGREPRLAARPDGAGVLREASVEPSRRAGSKRASGLTAHAVGHIQLETNGNVYALSQCAAAASR
jgi:hypothetical protein